MFASFVVAAISFWYPLNTVSLLLAFAAIIAEGERAMSSRIKRVSQGICETERPDFG